MEVKARKITYIAAGYDGGADENGTRPLITSVRVEYGPGHDRVRVWNRGGCSGELVVAKGDGDKLLDLLLPEYRDHHKSNGGTPEAVPVEVEWMDDPSNPNHIGSIFVPPDGSRIEE